MTCLIKPFKPEHLDEIECRWQDDWNLKSVATKEYMAGYGFCGPSMTLFADEKILVCAGIVLLWDGVGSAWTLTSIYVDQYPVFFCKQIRLWMFRTMKDCKLWRIEANVHVDNEISLKWIERLGFEREGLMKMYGPNKGDYYRFALCQPQQE